MSNEDNVPEQVWITWDDAYPWTTPETGGIPYARVHSPTGKDEPKPSREILRALDASLRFALPLDKQKRIRGLVNDLLATVRTEEREAAFKVLCVECAEGDTPVLDQQARWYYHGEMHQTVGCSSSKLRLEAANGKEEQS